jgi:uncharacterized protein YndB with AHSA1/START domain
MTPPLIIRARVAAPRKEVWHALTDATALRTWLAEHAEVDLPHRYEFWGRYTPDGDAPHQRLLHADDHTLRFAWLLDGVETTTELRLDEEDDATVVTLSQSHFDFQDVVTGASIRGVLQTYWSLAMANLADHVTGRDLTPRTDFTSSDLRGEVIIDAPVDAVYASLTDSEQASAWFGFPIGIEPVVGGRFAMGGLEHDPNPAKVVDVEPGRRMSIDWGPGGVATWELDGSAGKTRLTFVQSGFDPARPPYAAWTGWLSGVAELRRFHEIPDWRPIWLAPA